MDLNLISLFTGAGGMDFGLEAAGFRVCAAVEIDHDCCATIRMNREWPTIERDINKTTSREILDIANLDKRDVDLLVGGPPCQPFSKSGYWANGDTRRLRDPRSSTLDAFMRCVDDMLPAAFLIENVHGIKYSGKEEGFKLLESLTERTNAKHGTSYKISWGVLNAADYGVAQLRTRFFLVAHRDGKDFKFPQPTHAEAGRGQMTLNDSHLKPYLRAWDAIGHLEVLQEAENLKVNGKWGDLLPSIPEGENYLWHTNRKGGLPLFGWRTRYWSFLLKLAKDKPSWTIQAQPGPAIGPFHWKNRRLSVKEMASIQTMPAQVNFVGNRGSVQRQIGNAVPSLLSEVIARSIRNQLFDSPLRGTLTHSIRTKRPIPAPEPVQPVPKKYLNLLGHHPDHPGSQSPRGKLR